MTNDEYHAHPAVGSTALNCFLSSRREFQVQYVTREKVREASNAMDTGSMFHAYLLEPTKVNSMFRIIPADCLKVNGDINSKPYKEWAAEHPGVIHYKEQAWAAELTKLDRMVSAVQANPEAHELLQGAGEAEVPRFWFYRGVELKCKPDWLRGDCIVDIKTTDDISPAGFGRSVASYGYHVQSALYRAGVFAATAQFLPWRFVVVTSKPPFVCRVYKLDEVSERIGEEKMQQGLDDLAACKSASDYSEPGEYEVTEIGLPAWERKAYAHLEGWV